MNEAQKPIHRLPGELAFNPNHASQLTFFYRRTMLFIQQEAFFL